jgi:hypothetical protein
VCLKNKQGKEKTMKTWIFSLIALGALLTGCQKQEETPTTPHLVLHLLPKMAGLLLAQTASH